MTSQWLLVTGRWLLETLNLSFILDSFQLSA